MSTRTQTRVQQETKGGITTETRITTTTDSNGNVTEKREVIQYPAGQPPAGGSFMEKMGKSSQPTSSTRPSGRDQNANPTAVTSDKDKDKFRDECLKVHNKYRALHGVPAMTLDKGLSQFAQEWADNLARKGSLQHRPNRNFKGQIVGENVYYGMGAGKCTAESAMGSWYSEIKDINFRKPDISRCVLGIGVAMQGGKCFVVGNYSPAGNMMGEEKNNIFPPRK